MVSVLSIPDAEEERAVLNTRYGILTWADVGVGYAVRTKKIIWNVRVQPLSEEKNGLRPGVIVGSGSIQTGGSDQSLYAQLMKSIAFHKNFGLDLSAGTAALLPDFDEVFGLAGIAANIFGQFSLFSSYDGRSFHEGASWCILDRYTVSFMLVETENPAVSFSVTW
jgi:hypothetical protein